MGRRLTPQEAQIWAQVARTVKPLAGPAKAGTPKALPAQPKAIAAPPAMEEALAAAPLAKKIKGRVPSPPTVAKVPITRQQGAVSVTSPTQGNDRQHLDGSWERRISKGTLVPDFSLDLHGSNLDQAYVRLMHGLTQAKAMGARVVLVVTGKARPVDAADRATARGAIRAKVADWLAASQHASDIVALRNAHRRHGGQGALYVVLKKHR
ncbi:hypothetical protein WSK_2185 [Novosphingobium sp. Rr 2-17]|uniref:Smr/MutS family protein n=1 Tax=Novosphingobium sp. Rr 2-17 TaxID=555793 RepID=UPI0002699516|nr:Smr/MutS family protein [Novosphingobium sp. Rr 2-17]EIZ79339.1 hypothetical protein WSK_2185 [Novosphingobium sp. Rr 2-17]